MGIEPENALPGSVEYDLPRMRMYRQRLLDDAATIAADFEAKVAEADRIIAVLEQRSDAQVAKARHDAETRLQAAVDHSRNIQRLRGG